MSFVIGAHTLNFSSLSASQLKYRSHWELGAFMGWFIILAFGNFMKDFVWLFLSQKWGINKEVHFIGYFYSSGLQLLQAWPSVHLLQSEIHPDNKTLWTPEAPLAIKAERQRVSQSWRGLIHFTWEQMSRRLCNLYLQTPQLLLVTFVDGISY